MDKAIKGRNLAGIIPLAGAANNLGLPWPNYLQLAAKDYTFLERGVFECLCAGCDSIWIVCNDDVAPLVKNRVGDYVMDLNVFKHWNFIKFKEDHKKYIPVFYVPVSQKDRKRRNSLGWSILHGALTAFVVSSNISSWVKPNKYYVSFATGVFDPEILKDYRALIRGKSSFFISYDEQTVKDGKHLGFTFTPDNWLFYKRKLKENCSGGDKSLPAGERWSSRNFLLDKIFNYDNITIDFKLKLEKFYEITTWEEIRKFYKSDLKLSPPSKTILKPYKIKKEITLE